MRTRSKAGGNRSNTLVPLRGLKTCRRQRGRRRRFPLRPRYVGIRQRRKPFPRRRQLLTRSGRRRRGRPLSLCTPNLARSRGRRARSLTVVLAAGLAAAATIAVVVAATATATATDGSAAGAAASDILAGKRHRQGQYRRGQGLACTKRAHVPPALLVVVVECRDDVGVRGGLLDHTTESVVPIPLPVQPKHRQRQMGCVSPV